MGSMTQDEKLDEALKETFPASDAFYVLPETAAPMPGDAAERPGDLSAKPEPGKNRKP
jgi:hypothetical protein